MKEFDILTTSLTGFEENLLYLVMMDYLNPKHLHFFGFDESGKLSDEDRFRAYKNLNEEKQNVIKRDFLVRHMNQTSGVSKKSALFIKLVRLYYPEDLAAIEFDVQEEYQKKRENILAQIKKIESRQEENTKSKKWHK